MAIIGPADLPSVLKVPAEQAKKYIYSKLGYPQVEVEISEDQFNTIWRISADFIASWFPHEQKLALFWTQPLKSTYPLPKDAYWIQQVVWDPLTSRIDQVFGAESYLFNIGNICFAESSPVWTKSGPRPIAELMVGDLIYTLNPYNCILELRPITKKFYNGIADCVEVKSKSGHCSISTLNHHYLTTNGFCSAKLLNHRQLIETGDDPTLRNKRKNGIIKSVRQVKSRPVCDLRIPPYHNYVVDGAVVHNSGIQNILLDYHLLAAYRKFAARTLATEGMWEVINEGASFAEGDSLSSKDQLIRLYPTPKGAFPAVVLYTPVVTHFRSPQARQLAYDMMLAEAKIALGMARRKITGMPTPDGGGINYDGSDLVQEGTQEKEKVLEMALKLSDPLMIHMWSILLLLFSFVSSII